MATLEEGGSTLHAPETVGNAFVLQYYSILHQLPDQVHKFYKDTSSLSRPGPNGVMTSVTTMQGINDKITSFDYENYQVQILTADSQTSYMNGVLVFVTGCLTKENVRRKFTQSFFLAPQDKNGNGSFFVLNDIFRYVDDHESAGPFIASFNGGNEEVQTATLVPETDTTDNAAVSYTSTVVEKNINNGDKVNHQLLNGETSFAEKEVEVKDPPCNSTQNDVSPIAEKTSPVIKQDAPKKSFVSLVNALKENPSPFLVKVTHPKPSETLRPAPAPEASALSSNSSLERNNDRSVKGNSIYVSNLPCDATAEQLEAIFKKFGPIKKPDGIQVRSYKEQQSCFGFVEFESYSSVDSAIEASPIHIGSRPAIIELKKAGNNNDGGRSQGGRGGSRNDNFRPRGNYGGRGFSRIDSEKRGEYSNRNYDKGGDYSGERRGEYAGRARANNGRNGGSSNGRSSNGPASQRGGVYQNGTAAPQTVKA